MPGPNSVDLFTYQEAAASLRVHPVTLRRWAQKGRVERTKVGRKVYFTEEQIRRINRVVPAAASAEA